MVRELNRRGYRVINGNKEVKLYGEKRKKDTP